MMFKRYFIPIFLTATTLLTTFDRVDAAREARAILTKEIGAIAKKTVVRIESSSGDFGSGVIIGRSERGRKNIYTVLTAAHVVKTAKTSYKLITPLPIDNTGNRQRSSIDLDASRNIKILPNIDLAVVSFESDRTFAIGTIGNSEYADEGSPVYVAGFPKPSRAIKRIALQFTGGMVSSRLDQSDNTDPKERNNGYDLAYTNITRAGMSGGPVLDAAGRIVAIHGQGDRESTITSESVNSESINEEKTGFNLGIPIQSFLKIQSKTTKLVGARVDRSPINYQLLDRTRTIGTPSKKFKRKFPIRSDDPPLLDITKVNEIVEED
jgi:serine protease Do